jgi:hypothetical protein
VGKKQQKSKAIALTFRPFLATFAVFHKCMRKKQQKSKVIALTFRPFLATFAVFHKWAKNSKKVRL